MTTSELPAAPDEEEGDEPPMKKEPDQSETPSGHDPGFLTISNLLSLSRVPLGMAFLAVDSPRLLAVVVIVGAATDLLDGLIARLSHTESEIGVLLDPFCDKIFVLLGLISFLPGTTLDWAAFLVLILRDVFTAGSYLLSRLVGRVLPFRSRLGGKITTGLQVGALFSLIFWPELAPALVLAVGAASVYSIVDYGMAGIRNAQRSRLL